MRRRVLMLVVALVLMVVRQITPRRCPSLLPHVHQVDRTRADLLSSLLMRATLHHLHRRQLQQARPHLLLVKASWPRVVLHLRSDRQRAPQRLLPCPSLRDRQPARHLIAMLAPQLHRRLHSGRPPLLHPACL